MLDKLEYVLEEYRTLVESEENNKRAALWEPGPFYGVGKFRGIPKPWSETGRVPIVIDPGPNYFTRSLNFNLREYYTEPEVYLTNYLKMLMVQFELNDDTYLRKVIQFFPGVSFDAGLFGMGTLYQDDSDPIQNGEPLLKNKDDLKALSLPDFYNSGQMPLVHRFYREINDLLKNIGCSLDFPELIRSPYGVAWQLRGMVDLACDFLDDPVWVRDLLHFLTEAHKKWYIDRAAFTGKPVSPAHFYNDEVDCNIIGPNIYKEQILHHEIEISKFHGGIAYWHSCGNITPVLEYIRQIPNIKMLSISPWTDYQKAAEICPEIALEININPIDYLYLASREEIEQKINSIIDSCFTQDVRAFCIRTVALQPYSEDINVDLAKAKEWIDTTKAIVTSKIEQKLVSGGE